MMYEIESWITTNPGTSRKIQICVFFFPLSRTHLHFTQEYLYLIDISCYKITILLVEGWTRWSSKNVKFLFCKTLIKPCLNFLYLYTTICWAWDWIKVILVDAKPLYQASLGSQYSESDMCINICKATYDDTKRPLSWLSSKCFYCFSVSILILLLHEYIILLAVLNCFDNCITVSKYF